MNGAAIDLLLSLLAIPTLLAAGYLTALSFLSRRRVPADETTECRFAVVIPAHDEQDVIAATVQSVLAVSYPRDRFRVIVLADNCQDDTAARARVAGAEVFVRQDAERRGKGYALADAFERLLAADEGDVQAVVVVDADTLVSDNLLTSFSACFASGALAVQADYGVRNAHSSWRTRLMAIALGAFHGVRSSARERLGVSCGLRGNGMGLAMAVLRDHPPSAYSIVEDLEYGLQLGQAGVRVHYAQHAHVWGLMAESEKAARSQRRRWERGRRALVHANVPRLLSAAWRRKSLVLLDLALDLLIAPLGQLIAVTAVGLALALLAVPLGVTMAPWLWSLASLGFAVYVLRGWQFSGLGPSALLDLTRAPFFILWKLMLRFGDRGKKPEEWVRTTREARS